MNIYGSHRDCNPSYTVSRLDMPCESFLLGWLRTSGRAFVCARQLRLYSLMAAAAMMQDAPSPTKKAARGPAPPVVRDPNDPRGSLAVRTGLEDQIRQRAMAARAGAFSTKRSVS